MIKKGASDPSLRANAREEEARSVVADGNE
jgi:hypothetical protein